MERLRCISVPLNGLGVDDYNYGVENSENITEFKLTEEEFNNMDSSGIFDEINIVCNLLIDDYESEEIKEENLTKALNILQTKETVCKKLITALKLAIDKNTLVGLDF